MNRISDRIVRFVLAAYWAVLNFYGGNIMPMLDNFSTGTTRRAFVFLTILSYFIFTYSLKHLALAALVAAVSLIAVNLVFRNFDRN